MNEQIDNLEIYVFVFTDLDCRTDETLLSCRLRRAMIGGKLSKNLTIRRNAYKHACETVDCDLIEDTHIRWLIAIEDIHTYSKILGETPRRIGNVEIAQTNR